MQSIKIKLTRLGDSEVDTDADSTTLSLDTKQLEYLNKLPCRFSIHINERCACDRPPLVLRNVRAIEVEEGVFDLALSEEEAKSLLEFLAAED